MMLVKGLEVTCVNGLGEDGALCRLPKQINDKLGHQIAFHMYGQEIRFVPEDTVSITLTNLDASFPENKVEVSYGDFMLAHEYSFKDQLVLQIDPLRRICDPKLIEVFKENSCFDPELVRITILSKRIRIDEVKGAFHLPEEKDLPEKKILVYGTSLSQGTSTHLASGPYPYILARKLKMDVDNYSFAGQCLLEEEVVDFLNSFQKDYDLILFEPSTNLLAQGYSVLEFVRRVEMTLRRFSDAYPKADIYCIDLFESLFDHGVYGQFHLSCTPEEYREAFAKTVRNISNEKIHLVEARKLIETRNISIDLMHPTSYGYFEIAEHLYQRILEDKE